MNNVTVKAKSVDNEIHLQIIEHLDKKIKRKFSTSFLYKGNFSDDLPFPFFIRRAIIDFEHTDFDNELRQKAQDAVRYGFQEKLRSFSMSPLRTEPKRTYDESSDLDFTPGGDHIPRVLSQLDFENEAEKEVIFNELNKFGRSAGLYESIKVKHHGKRPSDPFQVSVVTQGPAANLVDVGYGVSQALPILVEVLKGESNQ